MSDLTQNLIPTGNLIGTLAVGAGTTDYNGLENKPQINNVTLSGNKSAADLGFATVATTGIYNDLINKPGIATVTKTQQLTLAANASGYLQLSEAINFPSTNSVLIGFFAYATLTAATAGTIIAAGLIENGSKPYVHYQTGSVGFTNVTFTFRYCFYTPPAT